MWDIRAHGPQHQAVSCCAPSALSLPAPAVFAGAAAEQNSASGSANSRLLLQGASEPGCRHMATTCVRAAARVGGRQGVRASQRSNTFWSAGEPAPAALPPHAAVHSRAPFQAEHGERTLARFEAGTESPPSRASQLNARHTEAASPPPPPPDTESRVREGSDTAAGSGAETLSWTSWWTAKGR